MSGADGCQLTHSYDTRREPYGRHALMLLCRDCVWNQVARLGLCLRIFAPEEKDLLKEYHKHRCTIFNLPAREKLQYRLSGPNQAASIPRQAMSLRSWYYSMFSAQGCVDESIKPESQRGIWAQSPRASRAAAMIPPGRLLL